MVFVIGALELDDRALTLSRDGTRIAVQRRVLDLILYLIRNRDRVVTDEELFKTVWAGVTVTRASIAHSAMKARRALGDVGRAPTVLESVRGRGLRFIAPVVERASPPPPPLDQLQTPLAGQTHPGEEADSATFSLGSEAFFDLARSMDVVEFAQTVTFHVLVFPSRSLRAGGNPWAVDTTSVSFDGSEGPLDVPARLEIFELWVPPTDPPALVVGRTRSCQIVVRAASISKQHARFDLPTSTQPALTLTDLASHNGTRVNRVPLSARVPKVLAAGDLVQFGSVAGWIMDPTSLHGLIQRMDRR